MNLINLASWTWLWEAINSLLLVICNWIYSLIGILYQVFEAISKVNLFDRLTFEKITSRIYIIMGVAMLFIFAYNIILMIINPEDKKTTGNTSKVVKETIISLVLVILLPTIFNYMYIFQNHVITSNILGQIILGPTGPTSGNGTTYDSTCDFSGYGLEKYQENHWFWPTSNTSEDEGAILKSYCDEYKNKPAAVRGAYSIAPTVLSAFYSPANFTFAQCVSYLQGETSLITDSVDQQICINYFYDVTASKYTGNIKPFVYDTYLKNIASDSSKTNIEFNGIMAVAAGLLAVWMFLCYSMEIGVRVAKLGVLQLISPIAVMMRIIPKQKEAMFDKWLKHLINTYLDVFIRLLIIFFALFAISLVEGVLDNLFASLGTVEGSNAVATFGIRALAAVIVILGILKFAQQAPDLLKEFFGSGGSFAFKSPGKQLSENKLAMGGIGATAAMTKTGVGNFVRARNQRLEAIKNDPNRDPNKKISKFAGWGAALKSGAAGLVAGGVRGFNEGKKTNDFANMSGAIDRAKAETDKRYFARRDRMEKREQFVDKYGSEFADKIGANKDGIIRDVASTIGTAFNKETYTEAAWGKIKETGNRWAGSGAMNDAKRSANSEVKGYASTTLDAIDSQTKGIVKSYEEQRDERIRQARPEEVADIRKEYSKLIENVRSTTIKDMDASALENLNSSLENLCDSLKNNQNYLEHFTGENGTLAKSISDIAGDMSPEFKKLFEGSLEEFSSGMKEVLTNSDKFTVLNDADRTAIVSVVDKISKTADNNLRGIANETKKSDKK